MSVVKSPNNIWLAAPLPAVKLEVIALTLPIVELLIVISPLVTAPPEVLVRS